MIMGGEFRQDLIHRFDKSIMIPPLRERHSDILPLANYRINELVSKEVIKRRLDLSVSAERALTSYEFPGNVRELEKIIFDAAVHACAENSPIIEGVKIDEAVALVGGGDPRQNVWLRFRLSLYKAQSLRLLESRRQMMRECVT